MMNCVDWQPARWPVKPQAKPFSPPPWCTKPGCDWWALQRDQEFLTGLAAVVEPVPSSVVVLNWDSRQIPISSSAP